LIRGLKKNNPSPPTIEARAGEIVIRSAHPPREGWEEEFRRMAKSGDDQVLDDAKSTSFDDAEWEW